MFIQSARAALDLVGKTVRPAHGTERWSFANGQPDVGKVVDIYMPDLRHPYVVVEFKTEVEYMYPFELDVLLH
jgi:hypothetical protein